jgi:hypothetical protein
MQQGITQAPTAYRYGFKKLTIEVACHDLTPDVHS